MSPTIIKNITNDKFEKLKQKYPKTVTSKRKDGSERIFLGKEFLSLDNTPIFNMTNQKNVIFITLY